MIQRVLDVLDTRLELDIFWATRTRLDFSILGGTRYSTPNTRVLASTRPLLEISEKWKKMGIFEIFLELFAFFSNFFPKSLYS